MPSPNTIKEYLVSLGFDIDHTGLRHFEDSIKFSGQKVEKFAKDMTVGFAAAGAAVGGTLLAIGTGTIALMSNVAQADLGYQMFARRMYMGTDAARKMKMATDALGYSIEEIVWGPPELAQRYHQLIQDETKMLALLGPGFEQKMVRLRDIGFQFDRMGVAAKIFGMKLTEDIINKLFGGSESLDTRMHEFITWFESPDGFVKLSDKISNVLAPALKSVGSALDRILSKENIDMAVNFTVHGIENISLLLSFLNHPNLHLIMPDSTADKIEGAGSWIKNHGGSWAWDNMLSPNTFNRYSDTTIDKMIKKSLSRDEMIGKARAAAGKYTRDPQAIAEFLALIDQESGFTNPSKPNPKSEAIGPGQVMPFNSQGKNLFDPDQNLDVSASMYFGGKSRHGGSSRGSLHDYYGHGKPPAGDPTFDEYYDQWSQKYNKWKADPMSGSQLQPQSYQIDVGGIHINQPNASPEQIKSAVKSGIEEATRIKTKRLLAQRQTVYA